MTYFLPQDGKLSVGKTVHLYIGRCRKWTVPSCAFSMEVEMWGEEGIEDPFFVSAMEVNS